MRRGEDVSKTAPKDPEVCMPEGGRKGRCQFLHSRQFLHRPVHLGQKTLHCVNFLPKNFALRKKMQYTLAYIKKKI